MIALQYISPACDAPFQRDVDSLIDIFFSGADKDERGPFTIVTEDRLSTALAQKILGINTSAQKDALTEHSIIRQQFKQVIIVSPIIENL